MTDTPEQKIQTFVTRLTEFMGISCSVDTQATEGAPIAVTVQAAEHGNLLIGKNGQNLQALEHVVRAMLLRAGGQASVVLDVNDYRKGRVQQMLELVGQAARRVRDTKKPEALPPMTSYERRIVHTELATQSDLATESVGQDPHRRVVIKLL